MRIIATECYALLRKQILYHGKIVLMIRLQEQAKCICATNQPCLSKDYPGFVQLLALDEANHKGGNLRTCSKSKRVRECKLSHQNQFSEQYFKAVRRLNSRHYIVYNEMLCVPGPNNNWDHAQHEGQDFEACALLGVTAD